MDRIERLLKELTEAGGVSGYEGEVRTIMRRHLEPLGAISQDKLGSLICKKQGTRTAPKILIAGHMDEIGFMVKLVTKEGFIKFTPLGGWPDLYLPAQRVVIQTAGGKVNGVIGARPPHLLSEEERQKPAVRKDMFIDIGATSAQDVAEAGVRAGDSIVPLSEFTILDLPKKTYMAKAFDDRIGCALIIEVLRGLTEVSHPNTVFGAATVQEEVGCRGATTCAEMVHPDVAIIADISPIGDVPGIPEGYTSEKIGAGPSLLVYDTRMLPNLKLRDMVVDTTRELGIPLQYSALEFGGYDGSVIHLHKTGVPTVVIGLPTRHAHSHNSILHRDDFDRSVKLVTALVRKLDDKTVAGLMPV
jgi:putative aminopeptidase FrvX